MHLCLIFRSTLQLWMLQCQRHWSIHICSVDTNTDLLNSISKRKIGYITYGVAFIRFFPVVYHQPSHNCLWYINGCCNFLRLISVYDYRSCCMWDAGESITKQYCPLHSPPSQRQHYIIFFCCHRGNSAHYILAHQSKNTQTICYTSRCIQGYWINAIYKDQNKKRLLILWCNCTRIKTDRNYLDMVI